MSELTFIAAIRKAIRDEMRRDPRVFVMGQDVETFLMDSESRLEFAPERIRNTPISEAGFVGAAIGAALTGMRPVVELGCSTFLYSAMDQVVNQAAKNRYMFGGQANVPVVIRSPVLYTISTAAHHSDRPWGLFAQAPGLKIIVPTTPYDAKGLLSAAMRDGNPVLCFEDISLAGRLGEVPEDDYVVPIGVADVKRIGTDVTIVAVAAAVHHSLAAAEELAREGISAEVIDLRTIVPLDRKTVVQSVMKTGRLVVVDPAPAMCGVASEVAATVAEEAFEYLKSRIVRLTAPAVPVPFSPALERLLYPNPATIAAAVRLECGSELMSRMDVKRIA
jgi:pyruvate/2-oxoglutarate/acetoin dehydrogenase E1 component